MKFDKDMDTTSFDESKNSSNKSLKDESTIKLLDN